MLDPRAPVGMAELEQGVVVFASSILALRLERRLDGPADALLPLLLLAFHSPPAQLILHQKIAIAGQDTSWSPLGAEASGHHSRRGLMRWCGGILWVGKPGLEPVLGPILPAKAMEEEEVVLFSYLILI